MVTWASEVTDTQKTNVSTTEQYFATIDSSGALAAMVSIDADNQSGSVTDSLRIAVYLSPDGGTDWDDQAFLSFQFKPTVVTARQISFLVGAVPTFRIGVRSTGATDQYTVDLSYRLRTA